MNPFIVKSDFYDSFFVSASSTLMIYSTWMRGYFMFESNFFWFNYFNGAQTRSFLWVFFTRIALLFECVLWAPHCALICFYIVWKKMFGNVWKTMFTKDITINEKIKTFHFHEHKIRLKTALASFGWTSHFKRVADDVCHPNVWSVCAFFDVSSSDG